MKPNLIPNSMRSENHMITFEVKEEKFPFFGKKYQMKTANDTSAETYCLLHFPSLIRLEREAGLEYVEIQNLLEFYDDNRAQFSRMLLEAGHGLVDPRGRLLPKFYDVQGFVSCIFCFVLIGVMVMVHGDDRRVSTQVWWQVLVLVACTHWLVVLRVLIMLHLQYIMVSHDPCS
uniref:Uncharacterized protein n=1 Tax=Lactuca sativa TaxID=4236 RepID=A0A9R1XHW7_LACSA|nr:hypothetical protein LSAT_V11C400197120 [Lactuca sativa]